jgi:hypothetical protein
MCVCNACSISGKKVLQVLCDRKTTQTTGAAQFYSPFFWYSVNWTLNSMALLFISLPLIGIKSTHYATRWTAGTVV